MEKLKSLELDLPTVGIFAFALASTWSLFQFFNDNALHPTVLYWIPAALVEVVTAWLAKNAIEAFYQVTRSNIAKQDRRFFWIVGITTTVLTIPTLAASVQANLYEFRGQWWLALLFPVAVVGCAIGAQIPRSVERHESAGDDKRKAELRNVRAELKQALGEKVQERAAWEQERARLAQTHAMKRASRADFEKICTGPNGNRPDGVRAVNDLLNESGFYAVPDSTARSWI